MEPAFNDPQLFAEKSAHTGRSDPLLDPSPQPISFKTLTGCPLGPRAVGRPPGRSQKLFLRTLAGEDETEFVDGGKPGLTDNKVGT